VTLSPDGRGDGYQKRDAIVDAAGGRGRGGDGYQKRDAAVEGAGRGDGYQ